MNIRENIQAKINSLNGQVDLQNQEIEDIKTKVARCAKIKSFNAETLLVFGNAMKRCEDERTKLHTAVVALREILANNPE